MKYQPIIKNNVMIFKLEKPIYGSFYGIWDKWLKIAKARNLKLVINTPDGTATYQGVSDYLKGAKKLERYFKNPNEPMIFYGRDLLPDIKKREERKKLEKKVNDTQGEILLSVLKKLKERKPDVFKSLKEDIQNSLF
ncbi:MAG: hypothetical protein ACPLZ9_06790 [Candidatus Ratteibacteria bacterium]